MGEMQTQGASAESDTKDATSDGTFPSWRLPHRRGIEIWIPLLPLHPLHPLLPSNQGIIQEGDVRASFPGCLSKETVSLSFRK
jgi:hypothetical protein